MLTFNPEKEPNISIVCNAVCSDYVAPFNKRVVSSANCMTLNCSLLHFIPLMVLLVLIRLNFVLP